MESGLSNMSTTNITELSLKYDESRYNQGLDLYNELDAKLKSITEDFNNYTKEASSTESEMAPIAYDGMYYGTINNISSNLSTLSEKFETIKSSIEQAKSLIESYNKDESDPETTKGLLLMTTEIYKNKYLDGLSLGEIGVSVDYSNIYDDEYIPQGVTVVGDKILITAYDENEKNNSRIYVYDKNDESKNYKIILQNKAHVGGVTYDENNNVLLVTGSDGKIHAYDYEKISITVADSQEGKTDPVILDLNNEANSNTVLNSNVNINYDIKDNGKSTTLYSSSTTYYDSKTNKIYIGRFAKSGKIMCGDVEYDKATGTYSVKNVTTVDAESGIQGISTYHSNGKTYLVESRSYGYNHTEITVKDITNGIDDSKLVGSRILDKEYGEGIYINDDGQASIVHEKGTFGKYDQTTVVDINEIIEENNGLNRPITINDSKYDYGTKEDNTGGYDISEL